MVASGLVDTSAIVALLDPTDQWHVVCTQAMRQMRLPLLTSEAVLTEVFHLIKRVRIRPEKAWMLIGSGVFILGTISDANLPELDFLMSRYSDRPMDFADATLVHLARRESLTTIFTIDHDDFETYRIEGKRKFRVLPGRGPH
jgi:uncharacterized protein